MMSKLFLLFVVAGAPCAQAGQGIGADRDDLGTGVPKGAEAGTDNGGIALPPIYPIIDQSSLQLGALVLSVVVGVIFGLSAFADPQVFVADMGGNVNLNDGALASTLSRYLIKYAGFYGVVTYAFAGWLALNYIASALTLVTLTQGYWILFEIQNVYLNSFGYSDSIVNSMKSSGKFKGIFAFRSIIFVLTLYGAVTALNADPGHSFNARRLGEGDDRGNLGKGVPAGAEEGTDNGGIALPPIYPIIDQGSLQLAAMVINVMVGLFFGLRNVADPQGLVASYKVDVDVSGNSANSTLCRSLFKFTGFYGVITSAFAGWLALNYIASALTLVTLTNGCWVLMTFANVYMGSFGFSDQVRNSVKSSGAFQTVFALRCIVLVLGLYGAVTALNADPGHAFNA